MENRPNSKLQGGIKEIFSAMDTDGNGEIEYTGKHPSALFH